MRKIWRKGCTVASVPEETPPAIPSPRHTFAADVERATVVAEAKLLVIQLDRYLDLIGEWAAEGWDEADA